MATDEKQELKKRTWHYIHEPAFYECMCDNDERLAKDAKPDTVSTHRITWSEYAGMLWVLQVREGHQGLRGNLRWADLGFGSLVADGQVMLLSLQHGKEGDRD